MKRSTKSHSWQKYSSTPVILKPNVSAGQSVHCRHRMEFFKLFTHRRCWMENEKSCVRILRAKHPTSRSRLTVVYLHFGHWLLLPILNSPRARFFGNSSISNQLKYFTSVPFTTGERNVPYLGLRDQTFLFSSGFKQNERDNSWNTCRIILRTCTTSFFVLCRIWTKLG